MTAATGRRKGGKRSNAGRKPGSLNKNRGDMTEIKAMIHQAGPKIIERLIHLAHKSESDAASVAACNSLMDRGFGKPPQAHTGDGAPIQHAITIVTGVPKD